MSGPIDLLSLASPTVVMEPARLYAAGRVFGGGFRWEGATPPLSGGDSHQYQLGGGAAFDLPGRVDVLVEAMPLGERSLTAGAGFSF